MLKIAVIGDVHDQWETTDNLALEYLGVDLALFVGDFGNESVEIVRRIASLEIPKAVVLGNHDAWYSATDWGRQRCPYDRNQEDRVQQQLDLLGDSHVGYGKKDFPTLGLSVVGSRPFTWGGQEWKNKRFMCDRYGINNFTESTAAIVRCAQASLTNTLIFIGHNGPAGLGSTPESICGRDWPPLGGDHGDPDFASAIAQTRELNKQIPLVTFGHMHHRLRHTKSVLRKAVYRDVHHTVYLNAARVPRVIEENGQKLRNFSLVYLCEDKVQEIKLVWLTEDFSIANEEILMGFRFP